MEKIVSIIAEHAQHAHWYVFFAILLAGLNIPISIDIVILMSAFLSAAIIPEHTLYLFLSCLFGCYFSAWLAYWLGRLLGGKLCKMSWFAKFLSPQRLEKMKTFYEKYGFAALIVGRFIPFGVRNCLFMSSGMSKMPFGKFALIDAFACTLWCSVAFSIFYILGQNYQLIWHYLKAFNLIVFSAFSVTVIGFIWYKSRKRLKTKC
ncbi:MAG TPA: DedA family protein [Rhabdochlamydiaceae bacterium]|jgi:membrane protein DedA with SNARE-associated domain